MASKNLQICWSIYHSPVRILCPDDREDRWHAALVLGREGAVEMISRPKKSVVQFDLRSTPPMLRPRRPSVVCNRYFRAVPAGCVLMFTASAETVMNPW